jgi:nitrile hydratase
VSDDHAARTPSAPEVRTAAIEALLIEKGLIATDTVDAVVDVFENEIGPRNGARVVARAWSDPGFKQRLLADATAAAAELGIGGLEGEHVVAVENTEAVHNVVVCTLCSCYPWPLLGIPPVWYKSPPYRARVVSEPRAVLAELGLDVPPEVELRVWDSSAEIRYLVVPQRPPGTDDLPEDDLATLVTRDAMIGVARALPPA